MGADTVRQTSCTLIDNVLPFCLAPTTIQAHTCPAVAAQAARSVWWSRSDVTMMCKTVAGASCISILLGGSSLHLNTEKLNYNTNCQLLATLSCGGQVLPCCLSK